MIVEEAPRYFENLSDAHLDRLQGKTFLVTGANGFIGSVLVAYLLYLNRSHNAGITVVCVSRRPEKVREAFKSARDNELVVVEHRLEDSCLTIPMPVDVIVHTAAATRSHELIHHPVEVLKGALNGTFGLLDVAKSHGASFLFLSSMEVYGQVDDRVSRAEDRLGWLDLEDKRSCYPIGKRVGEHLCSIYHQEYGVKANSVRLGQTFGPGMTLNDNRAAADFIRRAAFGETITLRTKGDSVSNYIYVIDALDAMLRIALGDEGGMTYNVCDPAATMTILEFAETVCAVLASGSDRLLDLKPEPQSKTGFASRTLLSMDPSRLMSIGWQPRTSLDDAIGITGRYFVKLRARCLC